MPSSVGRMPSGGVPSSQFSLASSYSDAPDGLLTSSQSNANSQTPGPPAASPRRRTPSAPRRRGRYKRYVSDRQKLRETFLLWKSFRWSLTDFTLAMIRSDRDADRPYSRRRAGLLHHALKHEEVDAALQPYKEPVPLAVCLQTCSSALVRELDSLIGKQFFTSWNADIDISSIDLRDAFPIIQTHAPTWTALFERITHNKRSGFTAAARIERLDFQRQLISSTAMIGRARAKKLCNFIPRVLGLSLYASGVPRHCIDVVSHFGICDGYTTLSKSLDLVARKAREKVKQLSRDKQTVVAYDNFQFLAKTRDLAMGASRPEFIKTTTAVLFKCPSLPPNGLGIDMFNPRHQLSIRTLLTSPSFHRDSIADDISRFHIAEAMRFVYKDVFDKVYAKENASLPSFPHIERLDRHNETTAVPLGAIFQDEGTIEGVLNVHSDIFLQAFGFSDDPESDDFKERLWLAYGDQKTAEFIRTTKAGQRHSRHPFHARKWLQGPAAMFHMLMALGYTNVRTHYESSPRQHSHATLRHDIEFWERAGLDRGMKFHQLKDLLHHTLYARIMAKVYDVLIKKGWLVMGEDAVTARRDQVEAAIEKMSVEKLNCVIDEVRQSIFTREAWEGGADVDPESTSTYRLCQQIELFATFSHAIKMGEIGILRRLVPLMSVLFYGAEQSNYGLEMLHFQFLLEASSEELSHAILCASLVSQKTKKGLWKPIDLHVEHVNGALAYDIKNHRNSTHDITATYKRVAGSANYATEARALFAGFYGNHIDARHSYRQAIEDVHTLASHLQRNFPFWRNMAPEGVDRFCSPNIYQIGISKLDVKVEALNESVMKGLPPQYLDREARQVADESVVDASDHVEATMGVTEEEMLEWADLAFDDIEEEAEMDQEFDWDGDTLMN